MQSPLPWRLAAACVTLAAFAGCVKPPAKVTETPPANVVVVKAEVKTVPLQIKAIGAVKVVASVTIRPRVGGELTEVHFKEGDYVKKGQKLFTIDPRPYETAVKLAEANLARDKSILQGADLDLARIEKSGLGGAVAAFERDAARTAVGSAKAGVAAAESMLHSAKLQLSFTTIESPIAGRTGGLLITAGNLLTANEVNPLVLINQIGPIHVSFSLTERLLAQVAAARREKPLAVTAFPRDGEPGIPGVLEFIDNAVDTSTGAVQLKANFPNEDRKLWPGQFVNVVLTVGERPGSVVVPTAAIQSGQKGTYVFLAGADGKAQLRPVTVAFEIDGEAVISEGLAGGETVVTEGQLRLAPGTKLKVKGDEKETGGEQAKGEAADGGKAK